MDTQGVGSTAAGMVAAHTAAHTVFNKDFKMPPRSRIFRYDSKTDEVVEVKKKAPRKTKATWPLLSDAAGVAESQVGEARHKFAELGLPTEVLNDGRVVFTSQKHRKEHCEAVGLYDRNGGYGDPQRNHAIDSRESRGLFD